MKTSARSLACFFALLALAGSALLGGCSTRTSPQYAASVVLIRDGKTFTPSRSAYAQAKGPLTAMLGEKNLRLGEAAAGPDTPFVALVEVKATGTGDNFEPVKVVKVTQLFKTTRTPFDSNGPTRDAQADLRTQVEQGFQKAAQYDPPR